MGAGSKSVGTKGGRVDCPACFAIVRPRSDGACPSCGADTTVESSLVAMEIGEGTELPDLCVACAAPSATSLRLRRARRGSAERAASLVGRVLAALGWLAGYLIFRRSWRRIQGDSTEPEVEGQVDEVELSLPACAACAGDPPRVVHSDFRAAKLSVVVHRDFRTAARKLRRAKKAGRRPS